MGKAQVVKEDLEGFTGFAGLVELDGDYFVVSSTNAMVTGYETLVFPADKDGKVTNWGEVAGGRGMSREEAIADLESRNAKV